MEMSGQLWHKRVRDAEGRDLGPVEAVAGRAGRVTRIGVRGPRGSIRFLDASAARVDGEGIVLIEPSVTAAPPD